MDALRTRATLREQGAPGICVRRIRSALGALLHRLGLAAMIHPVRTVRRSSARASARAYFESSADLRAVGRLVEASQSTGAGLTDYHLLHRYVLAKRPRRVLEFGSGRTSLVIAHALRVAHREYGETIPGHLYSMEDVPGYHENVKALLPDSLRPYVTFLLSSKREFSWRDQIWGFGYEELPAGWFDLVFVDGPTEYRDSEDIRRGRKGACLDLLCLLEREPDSRMDVVIDGKLNSAEAFQSVLPPGTVWFDPVLDVGIMAGVQGRLLQPELSMKRVPTRDAWSVLSLTEGGA